MSCPQMLTVTILLLLSSAALLVRGQSVKAIEGENVTLPCGYKVRSTSDITAMCWGRGACPSSKCNTALIWTDGYKVTFRSSDRYQLNGILRRGDVSLTIGQASLSDGGTYCCRIEHSGWFNDEKINIQLSMQKAPTTTPPPTTTSTTPVLKTTVLPTIEETTTLLPTPERTTTPIPTPEEEAPLPPTTAAALPALTAGSPTPTAKSIPPWPLPESTTTPTTTIPTARTTAIPQPPHTASGGIDDPTPEIPPEATEYPDQRDPLSPAPEQNATSRIDNLMPDIIPEATEYPDPRMPFSPEPDQNGMADLIYGNMTALEKGAGMPIHMLITGICLSAVVVALAAMFLVKMRWRKRGRYPVGFDPNLELVAHAEDPMSEAEVSQTVTLEAGNEEPSKTSDQHNGISD